MKIRAFINFVLVALTALYPLGVYLGMQYIEPRYLVLALLSLFVLRFLLNGYVRSQKQQWVLLLFITLFAGIVFVINSSGSLLFYPVIISIGLLACFSYTLFFPPSMVERLARIKDPNLSAQGVIYTRKVTIAWCLFFVANGTIATITALSGNMALWTFYNGLVSYILIGLFFAVEYIIRLHVKRREN